MFYIIFCEVYRVLNTRIYILKMFIYIYIYIYIYISKIYIPKNINLYTFLLVLKIVESPRCILNPNHPMDASRGYNRNSDYRSYVD